MKWYVGGIILILSFSINATVLREMSDEEIIKKADLIVSAKVLEIETVLEEFDIPFQYIKVEVNEVFKTNLDVRSGDHLIIKQIGGEVGDVFLKIDSMPDFVLQTNVFINLKLDEAGNLYVVGSNQGLYEIADEILIRDTAKENTMFVRQGENGELSFFAGTITEIPIEEMIEKIERSN